jgi:parallel beta-helix repeat protein
MLTRKPKIKQFLLLVFFLCTSSFSFGQANITIEVSWANWSSENRVIFRNPANVQIGASICNPAACFNGAGNNAYNNIGSPETYLAVPYGTNYDILLEDTWGDGWNGTSFVRVYQDGILIVDSDMVGGTSTVVSFDIPPPAGPTLNVSNVNVDEDAGTMTFTVNHTGLAASGSYIVNYNTVDGSAIAGTDYTGITGGTLNFDGTVGDSDTITVSITDDSLFDGDENFTINFTATTDISVDITDTATGTITDDEVILNDQPLTLFQQFNGYFDYAVTGGTFRTQSNNVNACTITNTSSATGMTSTVPGTATIERAYLIWAHSNPTQDSQVTFQGQNVDAELVSSYFHSGNRNFFGMVADVTSIIQAETDVNTSTYTVTNLTIDNSATYCSSATVLGGWSLMIFYEELTLPAVTINFYNGFDGGNDVTSSFTLAGFYAIGSSGSKTTALSWEGDATLANNENLQFITASSGSNVLSGDGGQTGTNPFNSTIYDNTIAPVVNNSSIYGVDLDTYDVSAFLQQGESSATTRVQVGQDLVIMNSVLLKVPSNLITGTVFEDLNYGGGIGRNLATSSGIPIPGAVVELYDNVGSLFDTQITDINGAYTFGGMANGSYSLRLVNSTVTSTRSGGVTCGICLPVQTYRANFTASSLTPITTEIGGSIPAGTDTGIGVLTGAQSVASIDISSEGAIGMDFGFNFNTIVNTNEDGQGSLEQFIVNSNALDASGIDIESNSIFDPTAGDDTSIFMIPPTGDALGRIADVNFASGYFDISISNGNPLTVITGANTKIDGRTQTAYSGDTNSGTVGSGGSTVGTSANTLPDYERPEVQVHRASGDVIRTQGDLFELRNISVFAGNNANVRIDGGAATLINNLLGVNALGVAAGDVDYGVEITNGISIIEGNYIAQNTDEGIYITGGTSTLIQDNHITDNGSRGACYDNIGITNGTGITIRRNLIDRASSLGIDDDTPSGGIIISENTITNSGQDGGNCGGSTPENAGIKLDASNSSISNNIIAFNGGTGIVLAGGSGNLISQNSIYAHGTSANALGIDIDASGTYGDGVTLNDTGDVDGGPNGAINFPIIESAYKSGSNVVVTGWSPSGATIEFFLTDINQGSATLGDNQLGQSVDYGEGQVFLASLVEGSGSDTDSSTSSYTDDDGNTDTTNKFKFTFAISPTVILGSSMTTTATVANSTSEFSPFSMLKAYTIITNRRITYRVNKN